MPLAESGRTTDTPPIAPTQRMRWDLLAAHLFLIWRKADEAELAAATAEGRGPFHDAVLVQLVRTVRPTWPEEDCRKFVDACLVSLRRLDREGDVQEEIRRRGYSSGEVRIVEQLLREMTSGADCGGYHEAQAVIAGMIGRLCGPEQRVTYIVDSVLDPTLEDDDDSDEVALETMAESSHPPAMTPFEERSSKILYNLGGFLVVLFGTAVLVSGGSLVSDLFRYGWQDFWTMIDVPGISMNRDLHTFVRSGVVTLAGIILLLVRKYLRGHLPHSAHRSEGLSR